MIIHRGKDGNGVVDWKTIKFCEKVTYTAIRHNNGKWKMPWCLGYAYDSPYNVYLVYYIKPLHLIMRFLMWVKEEIWYKQIMWRLCESGVKAGYNDRKFEGCLIYFWGILQFAMMGVYFYKDSTGWHEIDCVKKEVV